MATSVDAIKRLPSQSNGAEEADEDDILPPKVQTQTQMAGREIFLPFPASSLCPLFPSFLSLYYSLTQPNAHLPRVPPLTRTHLDSISTVANDLPKTDSQKCVG